MNLVSIIVPIYNCEKHLSKCIESIINQTYKNIEIILVDDGSKDASKKIIASYLNDNRIKYIYQNNSGAPSARNNGFENSNGDFVVYFDSDDIMEKNMIELFVNNIKDGDLIVGNYSEIDEIGNTILNNCIFKKNAFLNIENFYDKYYDIVPFPNNKMYKSDLIRKFNIKFDDLKIGQDLNFFMKYLSVVDSVVVIKDYVAKYRICAGSISRTYSFKIFDIINTFSYIDDFYLDKKNEKYYKLISSDLKFLHYYGQMSKLRFFKNYSDRIKIFNYFKNEIDNLNIQVNSKIKKVYLKYKLKCVFKYPYCLLYQRRRFNEK